MYVEGSGLAIGIVVPHDMALDRELWRWTPDDVTLLVTRTPYSPLEVTPELVTDLSDPEMIGRAATDLVTVEPVVYAYACTSGSFIRGEAGQQAIQDAITVTTGRPSVTTSGALVRGIRHLGLHRVAIANPYADDISAAFERYLREVGLEVAGSRNLGLLHDIWRVDYATTRDLLLAADRPDADGIVVCCTNLATYDLIADVERTVGKPVITANQATMWAALRLVGRRPIGPGQQLIESSQRLSGASQGPSGAGQDLADSRTTRSSPTAAAGGSVDPVRDSRPELSADRRTATELLRRKH